MLLGLEIKTGTAVAALADGNTDESGTKITRTITESIGPGRINNIALLWVTSKVAFSMKLEISSEAAAADGEFSPFISGKQGL